MTKKSSGVRLSGQNKRKIGGNLKKPVIGNDNSVLLKGKEAGTSLDNYSLDLMKLD
jgi:hypothetical protein